MRIFGTLCAILIATSAQAQTFAGKTITILVGFAAGQSPDMASSEGADAAPRLTAEPTYDQAARLYATHLGKFLPGNPAVDFKLVPGAGSLLAARQMVARANDEGTTLALLGPAPLMTALTGAAGGFDPKSLAWIGARQRDDDVCIARSGAPATTLEGAQLRETFVAALTPGSKSWLYARALNALAGTHFKIVSGYSSAFEVTRALETGEADVWCGWSINALRLRHADLLREGRVVPFVQFTRAAPDARLNIPAASNLPSSPPAREAMQAIESQTRFAAFALAAPAQTDAARLAQLRAGFLAMLRDAEFLADAARMGSEVDPVPGEELQAEAERVLATSPAAREILRGVLRGL